MAPLLTIESLHVRYGAISALHGISITVEPGEIVTLIGANGAGKSTTLRAVSGLCKCTGGKIVFDGHDLAGLPPHKILRLGLAQVPEGRGIFPNLTVDENLDLGAFVRKSKREVAEDRDRVFTLFPRLKERIAQRAGTLSGGEQQMLAIGRALLARPRLLLLDEPSLGLAPQLVQTIFKIIREINASGTTIFLVEQNAHMALQVAHRAYVLEVGNVVMQGDAKTLAASDEVKKAYLGIA
ncbi:MAG TPA: ABC transporter ATP-binding protein [Candidatus Polarisedimenticolaceae bacterium]|nr:ABC transporter ATP-binding protein [Candidatus Polarisedimenticolaceae bacterium]